MTSAALSSPQNVEVVCYWVWIWEENGYYKASFKSYIFFILLFYCVVQLIMVITRKKISLTQWSQYFVLWQRFSNTCYIYLSKIELWLAPCLMIDQYASWQVKFSSKYGRGMYALCQKIRAYGIAGQSRASIDFPTLKYNYGHTFYFFVGCILFYMAMTLWLLSLHTILFWTNTIIIYSFSKTFD